MRTHTSEFKDKIKEFGRETDIIITYVENEQSKTLTNEDLSLVSFHYESDILKSAMRQLDINSKIDIPLGTRFNNVSFGIKTRNNTVQDYRDNYDYVNFGSFYVYSSEKQEDTDEYKIICYDKMITAMKNYIAITEEFPMTLNNYINVICNQIGITFASYNDDYANKSRILDHDMFANINYTYRDIFDQVAQATGSIVCINENDELEIRYPKMQKRSKNLLDEDLGYQKGYINSSNEYVEDDRNCLFNQEIPVESGVKYTFSVNQRIDNMVISYYSSDDTYLGRQKVSNTSTLTKTIPSNVDYVRWAINYDNSTIITDNLVHSLQAQAEKGNSRTTYQPYIININDVINGKYLKDTNVKFNELYGPVNSIVLSRAADSDSVYLQDETSVAQNGVCELKISENLIMNYNDRSEYLPEILEQLNGLTYYKCDFESTGILYYDIGDMYRVEIDNTTYQCLMLNDDINITSGLRETIYTDIPSNAVTNYKKADKTDRKINETWLIVDKQRGTIEGLTKKVTTVEDELGNVYTKEQVNNLFIDAETGFTNTFSEAGGNNILRNTDFSAQEVLDTGQVFEYWYGNVIRNTNTSAVNSYSILLQNNTLYQAQNVANGPYTLSFYYKLLNPLATVKVVINDKEYALTQDGYYTLFQTGVDEIDPINVTSNNIKIEFVSNAANSCEIYDIMLNSGAIKLAYSQNANEVKTDTVNISRGITITSSTSEVKFTANNDGIRTKTLNDDIITEFTDKGMTTKEATIEDQAVIVGILRQKVGDQVWDSLI